MLDTLLKMLNFAQTATPEQKAAKAQQLAAAGFDPDALRDFLVPRRDVSLAVSKPMLQEPREFSLSQPMVRQPPSGLYDLLYYSEPAQPKQPEPAQPAQPKQPGLTSAQLAALASLMPKYEAPPMPDVRPGPPSQVQVTPLQLQPRPRVSLFDILHKRG